MIVWTSQENDCWRCCLASLVGSEPRELPSADDGLDLEEQNAWLASRGFALKPVVARDTWGESYPNGLWIAILQRRRGVGHAVLAQHSRIIHDPAFRNGWSGTLWPEDLAHVYDRSLPLGFELVRAERGRSA